jgi:nucleoside-diphosphate-sugar epimerase
VNARAEGERVEPPLNVLLVGGTGFLGRHIAYRFTAAGHRVTTISRGMREAPEGCESIVADRRDRAAIAAALEGRRWDFTVDLAAYDAPDVESLLLVPYAALGRYVLISTGQVYLVTEGAEPPFREEDSARPLIPEPEAGTYAYGNWKYGVGKRRAEGALLTLRASHGVRALILRLPILQGEHDSSLRLWAWIERMLDGGPLLLPDGGKRPTRHLFAGDVAHLLVRIAGTPPPRDITYNLAQPDIPSLRELLERVAKILGKQPEWVEIGWDEMIAAGISPGTLPYTSRWASVLDPARAAAEWGFYGTRTEEYLPRVVRWHLDHRPKSDEFYRERDKERAIAASRASR